MTDGDLWLSMMWQSGKARDLLRDPRILVHSIITSRDGAAGEFRSAAPLARRASWPSSAATRNGREQPGLEPAAGCFHLFAIDISHVSFISYDTPTGDQHTAMWPPGREFIRRGTSATSVGDPEPVTDLISIS